VTVSNAIYARDSYKEGSAIVAKQQRMRQWDSL